MLIIKAFKRTKGRFSRLYKSFKYEYRRTHEKFKRHGCSLHPKDVSKRSAVTACWASAFVITVALPVILYYRGISEPSWLLGLAFQFGVAWILFFILTFLAHFLWALSFMAGSKMGGSKLFLSYIENRWKERIDEITDNFIAENKINMVDFETPKEEDKGRKRATEYSVDKLATDTDANDNSLKDETFL